MDGGEREGWSSICFGDERNAVGARESRLVLLKGPCRLAADNQLDHSLKFRRKNTK